MPFIASNFSQGNAQGACVFQRKKLFLGVVCDKVLTGRAWVVASANDGHWPCVLWHCWPWCHHTCHPALMRGDGSDGRRKQGQLLGDFNSAVSCLSGWAVELSSSLAVCYRPCNSAQPELTEPTTKFNSLVIQHTVNIKLTHYRKAIKTHNEDLK